MRCRSEKNEGSARPVSKRYLRERTGSTMISGMKTTCLKRTPKGVAGLEAQKHADEPPKTHAGGIFDDWDWHTVK